MRRLWGTLVFALCAVILGLPISTGAQSAAPTVVIGEIQLGGTADPKEYVVLQNMSDRDVVLDGWLLEYAKPTFDKQFCTDLSWKTHAVQASASVAKLTGSLPAGGSSQPIVRQLTDSTAGSLRLVQAGMVHDLVAWGAAAPCANGSPLAIPVNNDKLMRTANCEGVVSMVVSRAGEVPPSCGQAPPPPAANPDCGSVVVSEILPNPTGIDTGQEFIELYNPTADKVGLQGCALSITGSSKSFTFTDQVLLPGEYKAFYSAATGLALPNAAGGEVVLSGTQEIAVQYPPLLADNQTWSVVDGMWGMGTATPEAANVLAVTTDPETNPETPATEACPTGKYRNPETNRCKTADAPSQSSDCAAGQERNPETNRCRSVATATSALATCKEGQERNPATNRCRAVAAATTAPQPCGEGEERNPETNRCRKVAAEPKPSTQAAAAAGKQPGKVHYAVLGLVVAGVAGYGLYEYRQDLKNYLARFYARPAKN
ncbi:MAG TPA: lamin tail domain-containing protein [Verrucomicrobiae bacterium]|nr:lamin tail domain-containing protein [Verrucomicrobiae bacterium]